MAYQENMRKYGVVCILFVLCFIYNVSQAYASGVHDPTYVTSDITEPTTWTLAGSPYVIDPNRSIHVQSTLSIEPGVVVKFKGIIQRNSLLSGIEVDGEMGGNIQAVGTSDEPIIFTSYYDNVYEPTLGTDYDPQVGEWKGIRFLHDESVLEHVIIRYAGGYMNGRNAAFAFENESRASISHSVLEYNAWYAISSSSQAIPHITDSILQRNDAGVIIAYGDSGLGSVSNTIFRENNSTNDLITLYATSPFILTDNTYEASNKYGFINMIGGIDHDITWDTTDLPRHISRDISVADVATLYIEPGNTIILDKNVRILVYGKLKTEGTEEKPVIFTSQNKQPGDWGGIRFIQSNGSQLNYTHLLYAGKYQENVFGEESYETIRVDNSVVGIFNSIIDQGTVIGIETLNGGSFVLRDSLLSNHNVLVSIDTNDTTPVIEGNTFTNTDYALSNRGNATITAKHNAWGENDASGPYHETLNPNGTGSRIFGDVDFDPWTGKVPDKEPVIIVPGIAGSELFHNGEEIWMNLGKMTIDIGDDFLNVLAMDEEGNSIETIEVGDIIRDKLEFYNIWENMIKDLEDSGYVEGETLFVFPYDWRVDNRDSAEKLNTFIENVKDSTNTESVDIVAHSMGGLVTKQYVTKYGESSIDQIIFIGTPHYGSSKSLKVLMYGDMFGVKHALSPQRIQFITRNMSTVYQLLPSEKYFDIYTRYFVDQFDIDNNNIVGTLTYDQTNNLIGNLGLNTLLRDDAIDLHNTLDTWSISDDLLSRTSNIVGCGEPTMGTIVTIPGINGDHSTGIIDLNGDKTVPLGSALGVQSSEVFYVPHGEHAYLPNNKDVRKIMIDLLINNIVDVQDEKYVNIRDGINNCTYDVTVQSVHSPVEIHAYDAMGNHTGPNDQGDIDEDIPRSTYEVLGDEKYIYYPTGTDVNVTLQGLDTGTFRYDISRITQDGTVESARFYDLPVSALTTGEVFIENGVITQSRIVLDTNDDGISDEEYNPSGILNEIEAQDYISPYSSIDVSGIQDESETYVNSVNVSLSAIDNEQGSGVLEIRYSIDDSELWDVYSKPFNIATEGVHNIQYYALDRAGNVENIQTATFNIIQDTTAPEFDISYSQETYDLVVTSLDADVICDRTWCTATDTVGNTSTLFFTKSASSNRMIVRLHSISYNGDVKAFTHNQFIGTKSGWGRYVVLGQRFLHMPEFVYATYTSTNNTTNVLSKRSNERTQKEKQQGLAVIHITTNKGALNWNIK